MTTVSELDPQLGARSVGESDAEMDVVRLSVAALQAGGDQRHFLPIFRHYQGALLGFFAKRGFSPEECNDLAQETFVRIYRGIASYRRDGEFRSWVFQIAANTFRNAIRGRNAEKRRAEERSLEGLPEVAAEVSDERSLDGPRPSSSPLDQVLGKERLAVLADAMEELPGQMQRCVRLRVYHDLKYREIAQVMQISIETVKAHIYQAKNRLRGELGDYFESFEL